MYDLHVYQLGAVHIYIGITAYCFVALGDTGLLFEYVVHFCVMHASIYAFKLQRIELSCAVFGFHRQKGGHPVCGKLGQAPAGIGISESLEARLPYR